MEYGLSQKKKEGGTNSAAVREQGAGLNIMIKKFRGLGPGANHTDHATAACRSSWCQLLQKESATWSA
jgi:hypothetical protein